MTVKEVVHMLLGREPERLYRTTQSVIDWLLQQPELEGRARSTLRRTLGEIKREKVVMGGRHYRLALQRLQKRSLEDHAIMREILDACTTRRITPPPPIERPGGGVDGLVVVFSDWHIGQRFAFELNRCDLATLRGRAFKYARAVARHIRDSGITSVRIAVLGDITDGPLQNREQHALEQDLHEGEQVFEAAHLMADCVAIIANSVAGGDIAVHSVAGNHDRAGGSNRSDPNRVNAQVMMRMVGKMTGVPVDHSDRRRTNVFEYCGHLWMLTHGDRKPRQTERLVEPWTRIWRGSVVVLNGHFHHYRAHEIGRIMLVQSGSLPGIESYAAEELGLHSMPSQCMVEMRQGHAIPHYVPL
jgi:predicted phosphodiesterase